MDIRPLIVLVRKDRDLADPLHKESGLDGCDDNRRAYADVKKRSDVLVAFTMGGRKLLIRHQCSGQSHLSLVRMFRPQSQSTQHHRIL